MLRVTTPDNSSPSPANGSQQDLENGPAHSEASTTMPTTEATAAPAPSASPSSATTGTTTTTNTTRESESGPTGPSATGDVIVLTPSRLRVDSKIFLIHSTGDWLSNSIFAVLILLKLVNEITSSWWIIFIPTWFSHVVHIPLQIGVILGADHLIYKQIGPPPPLQATPGMHLQYEILRRTRLRSHVIDAINSILESVALLVVKIVFCWMLESGNLYNVSFRVLFIPFWVIWLFASVLACAKDRSERMIGSTRDLLYGFFLFVAFKVDGCSTYSWRLVFLIPWMWFSALFLLAIMVSVLLVFARAWSRILELLLPIGFLCLLLSTVPQFVSYLYLVQRLDGDDTVNFSSILLPNVISWLLMWISGLVLVAGLRQKERLRAALLASGAVWTAHENVARRLHRDREAAQREVDNYTEDQIAALVAQKLAGKAKPGRLMRVGATLYKRATSFDGTTLARAEDNSGKLDKLQQKTELIVLGGAGDRFDSQSQSMLNTFPDPESQPLSLTFNIPGTTDMSDQPLGAANLAQSASPNARNLSTSGNPAPGPTNNHVVLDIAPPDGLPSTGELTNMLINDVMSSFARLAPQTPSLSGSAPTRTPSVAPATLEPAPSADQGEDLCVICYDATPTCVFLECGHGGFCRRCAYLMFVRPPNECPTCRSRIDQVVEVENGQAAQLGEAVSVR